jgi:pimeloyl-ACP methyl ester carboxylesterase
VRQASDAVVTYAIPRPIPDRRGVATSVDGVRVAWDRYGSGEPVILVVPTWNIVDARIVGHQVTDLSAACTVITFDPRGHGASDRPQTGYTFGLHAADALAVLDANEVERASILTASRGTNAAFVLATEHPERVDRIASVAPYVLEEDLPDDDSFWGPPTGDDGPNLWTAAAWRTSWPTFARFFITAVFPEPGSDAVIDDVVAIMLEATPEVVIAQERSLDWARASALVPEVGCPVLFVHGTADATLPVADVQRLADRLPRSTVALIPGAGHRPDVRSPELVNPSLRRFLVDRA